MPTDEETPSPDGAQARSAQVLFFSLLQDVVGGNRLEIDLASLPEATVEHLLAHLYDAHPGLQQWDSSLLIAVDHEFASRDQSLKSGQEIAIMPPVQGG